jgi:hypothetical protein
MPVNGPAPVSDTAAATGARLVCDTFRGTRISRRLPKWIGPDGLIPDAQVTTEAPGPAVAIASSATLATQSCTCCLAINPPMSRYRVNWLPTVSGSHYA